ncbi:hypothetical protein Hanom_Chr10g00937991 [Helianthus anomalus]
MSCSRVYLNIWQMFFFKQLTHIGTPFQHTGQQALRYLVDNIFELEIAPAALRSGPHILSNKCVDRKKPKEIEAN